MFGLGMTELLVILAIVLLIFGPKRLKSIGSDLGSAIRGFRSAVSEEDKAEGKDPSTSQAKIINGETQTTEPTQSKEEHKTP